jgi:hypothetical protein
MDILYASTAVRLSKPENLDILAFPDLSNAYTP